MRSSECPKSILLLSPRSDDLVQIFVQSEAVGGGLGPVETFPGWWFDSVKLLRDQKLRDENAVERAIRRA